MLSIPLEIYQGEDFYLPILYQFELYCETYPLDISGYSVQMEVRQTVNSANPPLVNVSTDNGGIIVSGPEGKIEIYITNEVTQTLPIGILVYDVKVINTLGLIERLFGGAFTVKEMVTRDE